MNFQQNDVSNLETIEEMVRERMVIVSNVSTRTFRDFAEFKGLTQQLRRHVSGLANERIKIPYQMQDLLDQAERLVTRIEADILNINRPIGIRNSTAA